MIGSIQLQKLGAETDQIYFRQIARIHEEEIAEGFLTTLGNTFLEHLYKGIASSPHAFLFASIQEDRVLGFICGSTNTFGLYKEFIIKNFGKIISLLLFKMLSYKNIKRAFETLAYPNKIEVKLLPRSEILNFCVSSRYQGKGLGKLLFGCLIHEFRKLGVDCIKIITGENQIKANYFYESVNAKLVSHINIHNDASSNIYLYHIE